MIRIADPTKLGPALEELRTMLGISRRALARAVAERTYRDTDSVNSQIWAWERSGRSPHAGSLAALLAELGWGLAFVPLIETAPARPLSGPVAAEPPDPGVRGRTGGTPEAPEASQAVWPNGVRCPVDHGRCKPHGIRWCGTCPRHGAVL